MADMSIVQGNVTGRASEVLYGTFMMSQATFGMTKSHAPGRRGIEAYLVHSMQN